MQQPLFFDGENCENEIYRATCQAIRGGLSRVAQDLWPSLSPASASSKLSNCLNIDKPSERLSFSEKMYIVKLGHQHDVHHYANYIASEIGYERPRPIDHETQQLDYVSQFISATAALEKLAGKIDLGAIQSAQTNNLRVAK